MECEFPTENATSDEVKALLNDVKTIAVIGLSPDTTKASYQVSAYMQAQGYKIFPIYPKEETILGEKVYRSLDEVPDTIDVINVFRKPDAVPAIVEKVKSLKGVKAIWLQKGIVNNEAAADAKAAGLQVVQNKCIMVEHRNMV